MLIYGTSPAATLIRLCIFKFQGSRCFVVREGRSGADGTNVSRASRPQGHQGWRHILVSLYRSSDSTGKRPSQEWREPRAAKSENGTKTPKIRKKSENHRSRESLS